MKDIKQIMIERKQLGKQIDHMNDIGVPDREAYKRAQARYVETGNIIQHNRERC